MTQFKNYLHRQFIFHRRVVAICGNNGVGKTNLLDAIHYLSFTRSYFSRSDAGVVQAGKQGFRIEGEVDWNGNPEQAVCIVRETGKKEFSINGKAYERLSQHIGRYPSVVIAPDDAVLVTGTSEERRRFIDALLCQIDPEYLQSLIHYNRLLQQRNALLRSFAEPGSPDLSVLEVIDLQIEKPGTVIFQKRRDFLAGFIPMVSQAYGRISNQEENLRMVYLSQLLHTGLGQLLSVNRKKDLAAQRSTVGIHRDELEITMGDQLFRTVASQGQRKSLLFALKLAELELVEREKGFPPLLLLDDVFEKLDEPRMESLLRKVCLSNTGQVFITDTNPVRVKEHLDRFSIDYQLEIL